MVCSLQGLFSPVSIFPASEKWPEDLAKAPVNAISLLLAVLSRTRTFIIGAFATSSLKSDCQVDVEHGQCPLHSAPFPCL